MKQFKYVQFGSGDVYIPDWKNYDASPTLLLQKTPILGKIFKSRMNCTFDTRILYGDIVKGLPEPEESVDGLFSSHVLEHLSLSDFHTALSNSFKLLKRGGRFRCILPNLEFYIDQYLQSKEIDINYGSHNFMINTHLGKQKSRATLLSKFSEGFSNQSHQWMWDKDSLFKELLNHGFVNVSLFEMGNCEDGMFLKPEREYQFNNNALAVQCFKP
jgi:predicted SAM-dependent methyltransferase